MLNQHKEAFYKAAHQLNCWIGLREPNDLSDKWIGKPGYTAKGVSCKAKTADNPSFKYSGLVVDPMICPEAFKMLSLHDAKEKWMKFAPGGKLPAGFTREATGYEKGLVKHFGKAIHADFDQMAICVADKDGKMGNTSGEQQKQLFAEVEKTLNREFRTPMIKHGAEFMYTEGVGARESESVYWFGPNRKFQLGHSSMPKGGH